MPNLIQISHFLTYCKIMGGMGELYKTEIDHPRLRAPGGCFVLPLCCSLSNTARQRRL